MHTVNLAAFAGVGFLAIGTIFSVSDLNLSRTSFELMIGPVLWIVGCALMVAWAIGRVGLAVSARKDAETPPPKAPGTSDVATSNFHRRAVSGQIVADFLVPVAIWLVLLSIVATIVLLLGYGPE